ncbi:hypothetical protein NQ315_017082 [Exocentrus adspersus]|uniref:Uncharacterized protein n=1 Tax=Exocentrus adspersus TaxID=1586481 RepID=A0AAV8VGL9_9CUCU|nr:hypothetical protein NQ315_017082 [Exocentrus adspersus]
MSSQKGNASRTRPQKHKNKTVFKNSLHDTSQRTKVINTIQVSDVCVRCKEIIEWKIKYKKYKPLTQPKTCVKCGQKSVKQAYHVMCGACGKSLKVCTKCCQSKEVVQAESSEKDQMKLDNEMKALLQSLPERKRRTFIRYMNRNSKEDNSGKTGDGKEELMQKLHDLKVDSDSDDFQDSDFGDSGDESDGT